MKFLSIPLFTAATVSAGVLPRRLPHYHLENWSEPFNATEYHHLHGSTLDKRHERPKTCVADEKGKTCIHVGTNQVTTMSNSKDWDTYPYTFTDIWESFWEQCSASPCDTTKKCFREGTSTICVVWTGYFVNNQEALYTLLRGSFDAAVDRTRSTWVLGNPGSCAGPLCLPMQGDMMYQNKHTGPTFIGVNHRDNEGGDDSLTMGLTVEGDDGACPKWVEAIAAAGSLVKVYGDYFSAAIGVICGVSEAIMKTQGN